MPRRCGQQGPFDTLLDEARAHVGSLRARSVQSGERSDRSQARDGKSAHRLCTPGDWDEWHLASARLSNGDDCHPRQASALDAEATLETMPSVLFDALAPPRGKGTVTQLGNIEHAPEVIKDQSRHVKPIQEREIPPRRYELPNGV
jgi:hypothetical protein